MALKGLIIAVGTLAAIAAPVAAQDMGPAPTGTPDTKYCMKIEAPTGSRAERVECWTRWEWLDQGVDVDRDWPKEGVTVIG
jgi:hypothetical protein